MPNVRKVKNPVAYSFIINEERLMEFKRLSRTDSTTPSDVMRTLIDMCVENKKSTKDSSPNEQTLTLSMIYQINYLIEDNVFLLAAVNSDLTDSVVSAIENCNGLYEANIGKAIKLEIDAKTGEFLTVTIKEGDSLEITSNVNNFTIHHALGVTLVTVPESYVANDNETLQQAAMRNFITTLKAIALNYESALKAKLLK